MLKVQPQSFYQNPDVKDIGEGFVGHTSVMLNATILAHVRLGMWG